MTVATREPDDTRWRRVLLELSGEAFAGGEPLGNALPIVVFDLLTEGNIFRAARGEKIGTFASADAYGTEGSR